MFYGVDTFCLFFFHTFAVLAFFAVNLIRWPGSALSLWSLRLCVKLDRLIACGVNCRGAFGGGAVLVLH